MIKLTTNHEEETAPEIQMSLDELARRFGIGMPDRHDAYGDALVTALIFQRQTGLLRKENICKLKDLLSIGEVR